MNYELKFYLWRALTLVNLSKSFNTVHMPRNITATQKHAKDFHKSDALAQTNQKKYDCFFCMVQKTQKKYFLKI